MGELGPGTFVTPHVRLVRLIGKGGMASVWLADHLKLDSQVAVKFLDPLLVARSPTLKSRFRREATAAAKIHSPHVVRTFDVGEMEDGTPYIVMELLEGESLGDRLERAGPLSPNEVAAVVVQSCKLLRKAHKLGIVHRDLKPDNIFLVDSSVGASDDEPDELGFGDVFVKILDFGIAKELDRDGSLVTMVGSVLGTPPYMSPEQIMSAKETDLRADLWALSVVAYVALTRRLPFGGETAGAVFASVTRGEFTPPGELLGGAPELDAFFRRAFANELEERFGSSRELAAAFAAAVRTLGSSAVTAPGGTPAPASGAPAGTAELPTSPSDPQRTPGAETLLLGEESTSRAPVRAGLANAATAQAPTRDSPAAEPRPSGPATMSSSEVARSETFGGTSIAGSPPRRRRVVWLVAGAALLALSGGALLLLPRRNLDAASAAGSSPTPNGEPPRSSAPVSASLAPSAPALAASAATAAPTPIATSAPTATAMAAAHAPAATSARSPEKASPPAIKTEDNPYK